MRGPGTRDFHAAADGDSLPHAPSVPLGGRGALFETEASMLNQKLLRAVLRNTGLARATWGFLATFVAASALLALVDPGVDGFGDALWCCFQSVTTIATGTSPSRAQSAA